MDNEFITDNTPKRKRSYKKIGVFATGLLVTLVVIASLAAWNPAESSNVSRSGTLHEIARAEDNKVYCINENDSQIYNSDIDGKNIVKVIDKEVSSFDAFGENIYFTVFADNNIYMHNIHTGETSVYIALGENSRIKKMGKYLKVKVRTTGEEKLVDLNTKEEKSFVDFLGKEYASFAGEPFSRINIDYANNNFYFYLRDPATEEFLVVKINDTGIKKELLYKGKEDIFMAKKQYTEDSIYIMIEMQPTIYDIYKISTTLNGMAGKLNALEKVTELNTTMSCFNVDAGGNILIMTFASEKNKLLRLDAISGKVTELKIVNYKDSDLSAVDMHMFGNYLYLFSPPGLIRVLDLETSTIVTRISEYVNVN